jgi:hypothetical protein
LHPARHISYGAQKVGSAAQALDSEQQWACVHDAHAAVPEGGKPQPLEPSGPPSAEEPPCPAGAPSSPRIWRHAVMPRAAHATATILPVAASLSLTTAQHCASDQKVPATPPPQGNVENVSSIVPWWAADGGDADGGDAASRSSHQASAAEATPTPPTMNPAVDTSA